MKLETLLIKFEKAQSGGYEHGSGARLTSYDDTTYCVTLDSYLTSLCLNFLIYKVGRINSTFLLGSPLGLNEAIFKK